MSRAEGVRLEVEEGKWEGNNCKSRAGTGKFALASRHPEAGEGLECEMGWEGGGMGMV